jgi:hypothetical protein
MSMTKNRMYLMIAASLLAFTGVANAANVVCPAAGAITLAPRTAAETGKSDPNADDEYTASTAGHKWEGSVSYYDDYKVDLKKLEFESAAIKTTKDAKGNEVSTVLCNYHGPGNADLRLASPMSDEAVPAQGAAWSKEGTPTCKSSDVTKCEVKES